MKNTLLVIIFQKYGKFRRDTNFLFLKSDYSDKAGTGIFLEVQNEFIGIF